MPDGLHQVSLAHANAAVEEKRVIGLRWTLCNSSASRMGKLVTAADDERVESVARVQLRGAIPVETGLRGMATGRREVRGEAAIMPNGGGGPIIFRGDEFHLLIFLTEAIDGFLDEIGVFVANMAELDCGHANEQNSTTGVAVARGLEPRIVGVPIDLFFQRVENAQPRIRR